MQNNKKRFLKIRCEPLQPSPRLCILFVWLRSVLILVLFVPRFSKLPLTSCLASKICVCFFMSTNHFYHPNIINKNKNCIADLIDVRKVAWLCKDLISALFFYIPFIHQVLQSRPLESHIARNTRPDIICVYVLFHERKLLHCICYLSSMSGRPHVTTWESGF